MPAPPEPPENEPPVVTPTRVVIGLCLLIPFVAMLWVGSYARLEPTFIGLPFFYWYQMLWVPVSAVLTMIAYRLVKRENAKRRAARGGDA
ncbi:hypothetical protein GCM10012287_28270 [Streptomyces daqingensis]|jgi:membrane protein implicated in regulation of membrane protease activity|uniref:DUF3311 domain-containing protein n=1 Tax=Streptomyces daqingensis TaxID=1472640 RepID=A0ABQ2MDK2_9ACTN|nr:DUF3311 domain-containing protein [Streptomyces daqingensis]GGO49881.1 hypothetical protein GCM10012287_28270 [Streptomyces daqingensis]